jgi:putative phosphonate metabolism protein
MHKSSEVAPRYAIYFCPASDAPLTQLGNCWLGRDASTGAALDPDLPDHIQRENWLRATESPRRYGFHATLKPPFRLVDGASLQDLQDALRDFCQRHERFEAPRLYIRSIGQFLALTLSAPSEDLQFLAAESVSQFERFRAPLTEAELAQRLHNSLSSREREHVLKWGYPYVFDTWKFHMTLTSALPSQALSFFDPYLRDRFASVCARPFIVDSICIFCEPAPGSRFHLVDRVSLRSS